MESTSKKGMTEAMPLTNIERNTQNEYTTSITREMSHKSHDNHDIITVEKASD